MAHPNQPKDQAKAKGRTDVNEGDVRATVAADPTPRPANPQTYDGGDPLPGDAGLTHNSTVDNTAKNAPDPETPTTFVSVPAAIKTEMPKHRQLENARIRVTEKAYIGEVLYEPGAIIESYSGPDAPHFEEVDENDRPIKAKK